MSSCALASHDVGTATTCDARAQSAANFAVCGVRSFGEPNPCGRRAKPRKFVAVATNDEDWRVSRADLPPKPYEFDSPYA